eukprot:scaffold12337_cov74-Phaeocystis_antarctica.AAC.3
MTLLREAALVGAASAVATLPFLGAEVSGAIAAGAAAGCAYLFLLGRETDTVGDSADAVAGRSKAEVLAVAGRLGVPVVLFAALAARNTLTGHAPDGASALSLVSPPQCAGAIGGFLAYKAPLLGRQLGMAIAEYSKPEAQAPLGMGGGLPTGSLGIALRVAQERRAARSWSAAPHRPRVSEGPGRAYFSPERSLGRPGASGGAVQPTPEHPQDVQSARFKPVGPMPMLPEAPVPRCSRWWSADRRGWARAPWSPSCWPSCPTVSASP